MDFQFHYGTIKSGDVVDALYLHFAFNSTMVRLKANYTSMAERYGSSFNSTMVRLKGADKKFTWRTEHFQFHYGTIKSGRRMFREKEKRAFNSTMVRLKACCSPFIPPSSVLSIPLWYD